MKKSLILLSIFLLQSCVPKSVIFNNQTVDLISTIIREEEGFKDIDSSNFYLHVNYERMNEQNYIAHISLNGYRPKENKKIKKTICNGVVVFEYLEYKDKFIENDTDPFYIPDSKNLNILVKRINDKNYTYYKLQEYYKKDRILDEDTKL